MEILIKPSNKTINVPATKTLLEALIENEIPISHSCLSGRCGICRCKVLDGSVVGPSAADGRLAQHGRYVLACQSRVETDSIVEIPEPDEIVTHSTKTLKVVVTAYEPLSKDIRLLRVKTNKAFDYSPGQFAHLTFWKEGGTRSYSMAGIAGDDELEFHIRIIPDGRVTSKLDEVVTIGSSLKINGPLGASYLRKKNNSPILCVAASTGLAPVLSIIRGALESGMKNDINLIFGARTEDDLYSLELIKDISARYDNFRYIVSVDHSPMNKEYFQGLVTDVIGEFFPQLKNWRIYLAGAPAMVEATSLACTRRGANFEHIYADAFYPCAL